MTEAITHQQIGFGQVVKAVQPKRKPGRFPSRVFVSFLQDPSTLLTLPDLLVKKAENKEIMSRPDISLLIWVEKRDAPFLKGWWAYRTELFEAETIQRMTRCFEALLEIIVTNPNQPVATLFEKASSAIID